MQLNETTRRPRLVPSAEFDADYAYTLAFGAFNSTNRTAYQTETAKFWYDESPGQSFWCSPHLPPSDALPLITGASLPVLQEFQACRSCGKAKSYRINIM